MGLKSSHWFCLKACFKDYTFCFTTFLVRPSTGAQQSHERALKKVSSTSSKFWLCASLKTFNLQILGNTQKCFRINLGTKKYTFHKTFELCAKFRGVQSKRGWRYVLICRHSWRLIFLDEHGWNVIDIFIMMMFNNCAWTIVVKIWSFSGGRKLLDNLAYGRWKFWTYYVPFMGSFCWEDACEWHTVQYILGWSRWKKSKDHYSSREKKSRLQKGLDPYWVQDDRPIPKPTSISRSSNKVP